MDEGSEPRKEGWPPLAKRINSIMHRPNAPSKLALPAASAAPWRSSQGSPAVQSLLGIAGSPLDPSYYSVSPPPGPPTSAPLIRQRALPEPKRQQQQQPPQPVTPGPSGANSRAHFPGSPFLVSSARASRTAPTSPSRLNSTTGYEALQPEEQPLLQRAQEEQHGRDRSESADTVRGLSLSSIVQSNDSSRAESISSVTSSLMIPFPRYSTEDSSDRGVSESPGTGTVRRTSSTARTETNAKDQTCLDDLAGMGGRPQAPMLLLLREGRDGFVEGGGGLIPHLRKRGVLSDLHELVLGMQCAVLVGVCTALVWVTVSKKAESGDDFWSWLWKFGEPSVGILLLLCFSSLVAHEIRHLSGVAHLYLQSGLLLLTTAVVGTLLAHCLDQESRAVKGVVTGCCMCMWVASFLGFLRAAVIWKIDAEDLELGRERQRVTYGTFVLVD